MTDEKNKDHQPGIDEFSQQQADGLESRRDFNKAGLAGGAILMSLVSRTALGTDYSLSTCMESNFASWHPAAGSFNPAIVEACNTEKDCSHEFWKITNNLYHQQCWNNVSLHCSYTGIATNTRFGNVFANTPASDPTLLDCLSYVSNPQDEVNLDTWRQRACREAVVALFNCSHGGICLSYLPDAQHSSDAEVITKFNALDWGDESKLQAFSDYYTPLNSVLRAHYPIWV